MSLSISVVVPVYNSEASLALLVQRLVPVLEAEAPAFEILLVNDGSSDRSWDVVCDLAKTELRVRGINLMRNYGQHNALLAGIRSAKHDVIITMDDDLQNPPEEIPKLLAAIADGHDVVYGAPEREQHGLIRDLASTVTKYVLQNAMGAATARKVSAFRAFRRDLREAFADYRSPFVSIDVLLTWGTTRFTAVIVRHEPRTLGASNYTLIKLITHTMNMATGFSVFPLQVASVVGFSSTLFGIGVLIYVVGRYLIQGAAVPGFAFLASSIAIFSGAQLFAIGIIGEYLARMHFRLMARPTFVVRSSTDEDQK